MSEISPQAFELLVDDLIKSFAIAGGIGSAAQVGLEGEAYLAWRDEFETSVIDGFKQHLSGTDGEAIEILRRVMRGGALSPADRANLTYSMIDALAENGTI